MKFRALVPSNHMAWHRWKHNYFNIFFIKFYATKLGNGICWAPAARRPEIIGAWSSRCQHHADKDDYSWHTIKWRRISSPHSVCRLTTRGYDSTCDLLYLQYFYIIPTSVGFLLLSSAQEFRCRKRILVGTVQYSIQLATPCKYRIRSVCVFRGFKGIVSWNIMEF
jgi:hypothetical protein